jgi:hypothetical protein
MSEERFTQDILENEPTMDLSAIAVGLATMITTLQPGTFALSVKALASPKPRVELAFPVLLFGLETAGSIIAQIERAAMILDLGPQLEEATGRARAELAEWIAKQPDPQYSSPECFVCGAKGTFTQGRPTIHHRVAYGGLTGGEPCPHPDIIDGVMQQPPTLPG